MKRIFIIGVGLTLVVAILAVSACAQGPGFGRGLGFGAPFGNLPPEQYSKIQALRQAYLKEIEPLQDELWMKETQLQKLWSTPKADPAVIVAKQKEIFDLQKRLQEKANSFRLEVQKVLPSGRWPTFGPGVGFGPDEGFGPGVGRIGPPGRR